MTCGIQNRHGKLRSAKHTFNKPFLHIFREAFIALAAPIRRATSTVDNVSERWSPFILNDINPLSSLHDAFFEKCKRPSCIDMPLQYALNVFVLLKLAVERYA